MAKKSTAELAAEGKEIKPLLKACALTPHNFALFVGPDDLIFHAHKTKTGSALRKMCKDDGSSNKGAVGQLALNGTVVDMIVEDPDSTPSQFAKKFRKYLQMRGLSLKVRLMSAEGTVLDSGEDDDDAPETPETDDTSNLGDDIENVIAQIEKKFDAIKTPLVRSLNSAPKDFQDRLKAATLLYKKAIAAKNPKQATKALVAVGKLVKATPSPVRILDELKAAGDDPVKLGKLDGMVASCATQVTATPEFMDRAMPEMRDLRKALKAAMAKTPAPANLAELTAMKEAMDTMFYDHVDNPPRSHGPEYHGPGLSVTDLENRVMHGQNPRTGAPAHGAPAFSASSFTDKGAYVDSQMALRTKALDHIEATGLRPPPANGRPVRLPAMEARLEDVLGANWQTVVQGVKKRTPRNRPAECVAANWGPDSKCMAFYDLMPDGTLRLVTLYPKPVAAPPPPQPRPVAPRGRPNPRRGGGQRR